MTKKYKSIEATANNNRKHNKQNYSAEEKIREVLERLRRDISVAVTCIISMNIW
jgi:hypothetical protein